MVHVVYLNNNKYENVPDNTIQSQIDALNRDFNLLNPDSINLRPFFIPFRGNAKSDLSWQKKHRMVWQQLELREQMEV
ncbi:MAG: hypothetical protein R2807_04875 [Chitinophagales bacterium]